ncbi:hypothetical protein ALC60_09433 [Trachymyrmex zeteki]|uniref:Uncharacterized protein n=1 Tax=Mycetomoellerius zeteki TaxID=64791 RepID=A0A151WUV8_9HYME|nr:hypothetical protein ALC60_09433 [Trachymyrmex zeteki]
MAMAVDHRLGVGGGRRSTGQRVRRRGRGKPSKKKKAEKKNRVVKGYTEGTEKEKVDEEETENGAWRAQRWERGRGQEQGGKKRTATCRMMKAVPVPDLCAIFTLVLMLHARREYLRPRDSGRARSKGTGLLDRYTLAVS